MILAAKEEMHVFPLAACVPSELTGNSYPGHRQPSAVLHQAIAYSKPLYAPGLPTCLYDKGIRSRCTGKERDAESGLDYFGARYFSGPQGRFTGADPALFPHDITDPQSWNKYVYTRNNPLRYVDPDGADWQDVLKGVVNAFASNNVAGAGRISDSNGDFKTGQAIGDAISTVTGAVETAIGSGGEALGIGLDATGVGAVLGVPLNVAAAGLIVHGATTTGVSGVHLAQDANEAISSGSPRTKPEEIADQIEGGGYQVKPNEKGPGQEGNITITHPDDPSRKLNIRVETGPIPGSKDPVRHANVQVIKTSQSGNKRQVRNIHITEDKQ